MTNARDSARRAGVKRPGPAERERVSLRRERDRERQKRSRLLRREELGRIQEEERLSVREDRGGADESSRDRDRVIRREVSRDVATILECVKSTLGEHRDGRHREAVLQALWANPFTATELTISKRVSDEAKAQASIVSGLVQSLSEVKNAKTRAQLVSKHAILTAVVSSRSSGSGSARQTARLLNVHHRNVTMAVQRRASMGSSEHIIWTLSVRKQRSDRTSDSVKAEVIAWWIGETRASPNRKEVVKKWIAAGVYEKHHTQYLLESQV